MVMNRRTFSAAFIAAAAATIFAANGLASPALGQPPKAKNIVIVHGLFADGSCWDDVIPLLQSKGSPCCAIGTRRR
jgi:hypothetical protein